MSVSEPPDVASYAASALPSPRPDVSVVIPTRARPELLDRCLAALDAQQAPAGGHEVIVVDDGPDEATRAVVARHRGVRYLSTAGGLGPAAARNLGWRTARAPLIAFTDDDCIPSSGWLEAGVASLIDGVDGAAGRLVVPMNGRPLTDYERTAGLLAKSRFVTANCFYRRTALESIGGFDERFRRAWREDADVYLSLRERESTLVSAPDAVVVHPVRPAPWGVSLRQQRQVADNPLLFRKHRSSYRECIQRSPRWYYLPVGLLALTALAAPRRRRLAAVAGSLWLTASLVFAVRRLTGTSHAPAHVAEMAVTSALIPPLSVFWRLVGSLRHGVLFW